MRVVRGSVLLAVALVGCSTRGGSSSGAQSLSPSDAAATQQAVRLFAAAVARDVTQQGPLAWSRYFEDGPAFFMAVNGEVAFASGRAARDAIPNVALTYKRIDLKWGEALRIDPLTRELAVVASPWREVLTDSTGHTMTQTGFFTGLAEYRNGRWQLRDAHWSSPIAPPAH